MLGQKNKGAVSHAYTPLFFKSATTATAAPMHADSGSNFGCGKRDTSLMFQLSSAFTEPDLGLHDAVSRGDIGSICYALLGGQPIDSLLQGLQPIHMAAIQEDTAVIDLLLQKDADVNAQTLPPMRTLPPRRMTDEGGGKRVKRGSRGRKSFSLLRDSHSIGPISSPMGFTAGLHAMETATETMFDNENKNEAPTSNGYWGATPLHYAIANGQLGCAKMLVQNGARLDIYDSYGNTPGSLAAACGNPEMAAFILTAESLQMADSSACGIDTDSLMDEHCVVESVAGLAMQLPSPNSSATCSALSSPMGTLRTPECGSSAAVISPASPNRDWRSNAVTATATGVVPANGSNQIVLARRHTTGEADATSTYALRPNFSPLAATDSPVIRHRNTSPIGIRALSANQTHRQPQLLRQYSADSRLSSVAGRPNERAEVRPPRRQPKVMTQEMINTAAAFTRPSSLSQQRSQYELNPGVRTAGRLIDFVHEPWASSSALSRNSSSNSRRERSYTDSIIENAWRRYLEDYADDVADVDSGSSVHRNIAADDDSSRPVPEPWMWKQAAMAIRKRRSQSLSANNQQQKQQQQQPTS
ncbi:hypothetical protein LPJ66_006029 [Kickxella alabastrina]|uniref:Uncharacterized protein n=1 Tax=Kickxella alabastrina TaxID=61397 RepID=A0ACC1ID24_9FUNG|nr:hypothetical protein LPJ66_006029 [Kickxella alabastrina]